MTGRVHALVLGLALCAATAGAQTPGPTALQFQPAAPAFATQATQRATVGPVLRTSAVGVESLHRAAPLDATAALPAAYSRNQSRAMMIVGGAALIVGAIIGDTPGTIVMVGGAVVGLIGLYDYLQ
ncbi:MAG: hypothetical protein KGL93_12495 [Gemmatimonadota bacterium]|nr:hypothetical protein [Gemmatimonadota bacterium]